MKHAKRKHIVHIVSSLRVGGMEHFVVRLAHAQQSQGHSVSLLALQSGGPLGKQAEALGLRVATLGGANSGLRALRGAWTLAQWQPDIVHAHNPASLHYALLGKRIGRAKVVLTCHGRGKGGGRQPGATDWEQTDAVVAVSQAVAQEIRSEIGRANLRVILNGVEAAKAKRSRKQTRAEFGLNGEIVGIMTARIDAFKGHETLLSALSLLREDGHAACLLIVGDGEARPAREQQARELGLGLEQVRFLGFREDVPDLLAAADFFTLPSLTEGLPLSVLEAMSHRLPVVATCVGGIPELVTHEKHGLLVPPQDPLALSSALAQTVMDADRRAAWGEAGYQRVQKEFSFTAMACSYEALYEEISRK